MSAKRDEARALARELETLRQFLMDGNSDTLMLAPQEETPHCEPKTASVSYLNPKIAPGLHESEKEKIRAKAAPLIQELVDNEMIRLEQQLIEKLNHHLEYWMDRGDFSHSTEPETSYYR